MMFYIFGFYKFCKINKLNKHKNYFIRLLENNNTKGTIIFSKEGLNGTLSGSKKDLIKVKKGEQDILFLNNRGSKLTRVMIYTILNNLAIEIGLKKKISPHVLRHSFATHLIENGANIISIQKMMGHENIVTTEKYLHVRKKHLFDSVLKFHPRI